MNTTTAQFPNIIDILRALSSYYEDRWGVRPILTIACVGYSDEHWQLRHPADSMPHITITRDGQVEYHPDSPRHESVSIIDNIPRI